MSFADDVTEPPEPAPTDLVGAALELVELMSGEERAELVACLVEQARPASRQSAQLSQAFAWSAEVP